MCDNPRHVVQSTEACTTLLMQITNSKDTYMYMHNNCFQLKNKNWQTGGECIQQLSKCTN